LGKKVILVGTSTGGTVALKLAATYPEINSLILLSPNVAINDKNAWLLNNPWGLQIARKVVGGDERKVDDRTDEYKKYWYTNYRLESLVELEEFIESSMVKTTFQKVKQPVLMLYYYKNELEQDPVVRVDAMLKMFDELGTPNNLKRKVAIPNAGNHVMGSYITSKDLPGVEKAIEGFVGIMLKMPVQ
jgi:esterase/lipase